MPDLYANKFSGKTIDIYRLAALCGTTPGSIRCYVSRGILKSRKVKLKKGVRPVHVFDKTNADRFIREHCSKQRRIRQTVRYRCKLECQRVFTLREAGTVRRISGHLNQTVWGKESFNEHGELMVSFKNVKPVRYIDMLKRFSDRDIRTIIDHPYIGFCLIKEKSEP